MMPVSRPYRIESVRGVRYGRHAALLLLLIGFVSGCASQQLVQVRPVPHNPLAEQFQLNAWSGPKPSERTLLVLRRYSLADKFSDHIEQKPEELLASLTRIQQEEPSRETVYALAEISYIAGAQAQSRNKSAAIDHYLTCILHASDYLFSPQLDATRNPYDPQFRGACALYNGALENSLRIAREDGLFRPDRKLSFASVGRTLQVPVEPMGFRWAAEAFDTFEFVSDFEMQGLDNRYRTYGLGVPLIAIRKGGTAPAEMERHYAQNLTFPVTAFLRLEPGADGGPPSARLELYDPLETTAVDVAGLQVPLESDISTPLAYFLDGLSPEKIEYLGLFRPDQAQKIAGLYMVQPYQPGKIPVLMIHGLWSSPMTWLEAFNDLQAMPDLRERYQFWFYLYPSGKPFWETSADLREHLAELHRVLDVDDPDSKLDQMVLVGHSMGGLIARMMTVDSGNAYWSAVSETPFQLVKAEGDVKEQIERIYFFERERSVSRVITIGSPHRGSEFSNPLTRRLLRPLVTLPQKTLEATAQLVTLNPGLFRNDDPLGYETSVDSLAPESPILRVLLETPKPEAVKYHNVVGVTEEGPLETNTDGVVPYSSAHLNDVESELVVRADHMTVHRHPETIREIRRILKRHLTEIDHGEALIVPVQGTGHGDSPYNEL